MAMTTTFVVCTTNKLGCDFLEQVAKVLARTINDRDTRESVSLNFTPVGGGGVGGTVASA